MNKKINLFLFILSFVSFSHQLLAQEVSQIKGSKVLLKMNGMLAEAGDEFYAIDNQGKKKAILKIRQVKGDKAIAEVIKGQAQAGFSIQSKSVSASKQTESNDESSSDNRKSQRASRPRGFWGKILKRNTQAGVLGGLSQNTMSLTAKSGSSSEDITMTGMSYTLEGFYDMDLSPMFTARLKAGLVNFEAKSSTSIAAVCSNSSSCDAKFGYLAGEASGHFNIIQGPTRVWVGAGLAFFFAISKSSSVSNLDTGNSTNQMFLFGGGADIGMGGGAFIPVSLDYGYFPSSSGIKASMLLLRGGYGWRF